MLFKDIIGQDGIKKQLVTSAHKGIIPHAQLFCGPEGIGKFSLAVAYAQYLNCENPLLHDSCGVCLSCIKYNRFVHPDLHFVFPIVKKSSKKEICDDYIADWREFIKQNNGYFNFSQWMAYIEAENSQGIIYAKESEEIIRKLNLRIYEGKYKVMIIWLPEKMHESCSNKLLKIIEEPLGDTLFLLVSDFPDNIITTIQSRCQRVNIHGVDAKTIARSLEQVYSIDESEADNIAHISKGSYLKALETISLDEEHKFFFDLFIKMMRASYTRNIKEIKNIGNELAAIGRERQKNYLIYSQQMIREYFISNFKQPEMIFLTREENSFGVKFSQFINERNIISFMDELSLAEKHVEQNVNPKMIFFDLCLKITMLIKQ